jgi:hypothetical protein
MKTLISTILLFSSFFIGLTGFAHAGESFVPLQKGIRMASDDLIYGGNTMTAREAQDLSQLRNIDLSLLAPKENEIWSPEDSSSFNDQEAISLEENTIVNFEGSLTSNSGLYRFNAIPENGAGIYTVHLDKNLHSMLLRKNLLRKLGYKIPAIKYIKKVQVRFRSVEEREQFLKKDIPEATLGAAERWVKKVDDLLLEVQDVAVTEPSETDFYNVALGIPTQTINSRTLRSLLLPYSLADLYESINRFSWIDGKVDNKAVVLSHFTGNEFATTIEDAQWILRKMNRLSREDFKSIIANAYFPEDVSAVLVEKLISRRNSLNRLFGEKTAELNFNHKINVGDSVKEGKIVEKDYPGYASRFAYGDAESPFEQLRFYLYAKIQSNIIDNAVLKFNSYLEAYDINKTRSKFFQKQFEDGLNHFIQTGELIPIGIDTWSSPIASGSLILSRDIVLGNYLGTDNLVQLADTFGASIDLGAYLGVEGLGAGLSASVKATTSLVRTFSHVKPVKNLRDSLKEPYKNMFVNLLKRSLREKYFSLSELKNSTESNDAKAKKIQELLKEIDQYLDTGESLIMTDRFMPTASVKLNFSTGLIGAGVGIGGGVTAIKRIHIYKKSPKVLQIYDDKGFVKNINLSFAITEYISLLKITGQYDAGNYKMKSYNVNLSSDLEENPNFYASALGVYNVLKDKNFEVLNSNTKPVEMEANFKDRSANFSLLFWKMKSIKGKTFYNINARDGINGKYFSVNKDFMSGINAEAFSKRMANYYLSQKTDGNVAISEDGDANPGDTFFGRSYTQSLRFEAEVGADQKFSRKFLSLSDSKQGWALSPKKLKKMMSKVNEKFQSSLFDVDQVDFEKLRLFRIGYHINLYDRGIEKLNSIKTADIDAIEARYQKERGCSDMEGTDRSSVACGNLGSLRFTVKRCLKQKTDEDLASCDVELFDDLFTYLEFKDFLQIIGENNLYIYGTMDGFRQHSEILNDTIYSNTVGKIGSKQWNGPLDVVRELLGLSDGEFSGAWLRVGL